MRAAGLALALLLAAPAFAQKTDSLDWHRYAPLAVGNAWQHLVQQWSGPFLLHTRYAVAEVVGGRMVDGLLHAEVVECSRAEDDPTPCNTSGPRSLVRYDEATASVVVRREANGEVTYRPWGYYPCGLDAPGGEVEVTCADGAQEFYYVMIEPYEEASLFDTTLPEAGAYKTYATLASGMVMQSDVGLTLAGFGDPGCTTCVSLVYARLDGVEYGTPVVVVANEAAAPPEAEVLAVFPNPLRDAATLRFGLDASERLTLEVYDVRGRRLRTLALGPHSVGPHEIHFDAADLPPGVYRLHLTGDGGFDATRGVIVTR